MLLRAQEGSLGRAHTNLRPCQVSALQPSCTGGIGSGERGGWEEQEEEEEKQRARLADTDLHTSLA